MKPVVKYRIDKGQYIAKDYPAYIQPVNHPSKLVSNEKFVLTSIVQSYNKDTGEFETKNTLYEPLEVAK